MKIFEGNSSDGPGAFGRSAAGQQSDPARSPLSNALLERGDWAYLLSLLVPLAAYNLSLKVASVRSQVVGDFSLFGNLRQMWSDVCFNLAYILFWVALFAAMRRSAKPLRWAAIVLLHASALLLVILTTSAHQYFRETGTTLDFGIVSWWITKPSEITPVLIGSVPLSAWILLLTVLSYLAVGPAIVKAVVRRWEEPRRVAVHTVATSSVHPVKLFALASALAFLSTLIGIGPQFVRKSFAREPFVNLILTGVRDTFVLESGVRAVRAEVSPKARARVSRTSRTNKRNVVLISLESTRVRSVTPYNASMETTPFLSEMAANSLVAERHYTTVPHTSKANTSVNCGIDPPLGQPTREGNPEGIPVPCLAALLKDQGYRTVLFESAVKNFENRSGMVKNFGYDEYYPLESMSLQGFARTNYFGYEDDIMLRPSEMWLRAHLDGPIMAEYITGAGHHNYQCPSNRYGRKEFVEDVRVNSYLNCLRYLDFFVRNLIAQYKELGLYDNTIFVLYGDHGEGFGEHGRYVHDDVIWEEGVRVPLLIHASEWFENGDRVTGLSNHTDILPTVLEMLGYEIEGGQYRGYSLLHALPTDRTLNISCFYDNACLASVKGTTKFIYHYDSRPAEVFNLFKDPLELRNLAGELDQQELDRAKNELLAWRARTIAAYSTSNRE